MRVTCGSAVISHEGESESPSPDESDWKDEAADESGGNMRNLRVLERQRGVGIESFTDRWSEPILTHLGDAHQPRGPLRVSQIGHNHANTSHEQEDTLLAYGVPPPP